MSKKNQLKGKIDEYGLLHIERRGKMRKQSCPFTDDTACGDWCPLFGIPFPSRWMGSPDPDKKGRELNDRHWNLTLCKTDLYFEKFTEQKNN